MPHIDDIDLTDPKLMEAFEAGWDLAHEPARCGHARANWKDPNYGTPKYKGHEKCEFCAALKAAASYPSGYAHRNKGI